jgi:peptidoglycan/LPS O-acetylase OafA/YrhL
MEPSVTEPAASAQPRGRQLLVLLQRVVAWCTVAVLTAMSALLGLLCVFQLPPVVHVDVAGRLTATFAAAFAGNLLTSLYAARTTGSRSAAVAPAAAWLIAVVFFAIGRGEGDSVYLSGTLHGVLLPPVAMLGATVGLIRGYRRPWAFGRRRRVQAPTEPPGQDDALAADT